MAVKALECPKCGASLPAVTGQQSYSCAYCRTNFTAPAPPQPAPPQPAVDVAQIYAQQVQRAQHAGRAAGRVVLSAVVVMVLLGGVSALLIARTVDQDVTRAIMQAPGRPMGAPAMPGMPVVPRSEGRSTWDDVAGPPVPAVVSGQAAVLGRIRVSPDDQLHIVAARAADGGTIYRVGPLGSYSDGYRATLFQVSGERLVISDFRPTLRVVELASGAAVKEFPLSDRVEAMCTAPSGEVGVLLVDERRLRVDPAALTVEEGAPKECSLERDPFRRPKDPPGVKKPKIEGFKGERILVEGDLAVSNGHKDPGTAIPMAAGFDPKTGAKRWLEVVPAVAPASVQERSNSHAALSAGRFFTLYKVGSEQTNVGAFDAETGARLWDQELRPIFAVDSIDGVVATEEHVFVVRTSSLDILDAKSGALRGTVGDDTYDR